ncbi:hypothetical protein B0H13DRAFT_2305834 [Mycena leptocephala]|nr:hypothetical protein B0H13DRAFT_2305834 [Mycena leptocephala]
MPESNPPSKPLHGDHDSVGDPVMRHTQPPFLSENDNFDKLIMALNAGFVQLGKQNEEQTDRLQKAVEALKPKVAATDEKTAFWTVYKTVSDEYDKEFQQKYSTDLDAALIFAGLFSAVSSAFIIQIQSAIQPHGTLLTIIVAQSLLYISLFSTLLAALLAVLGKQWLIADNIAERKTAPVAPMSLAPAASRPGACGQCPWWWGSTTAPLPSLAVARTLPTAEVYSQDLGAMDYHVIGDAVWLIPVGSPENFDLSLPAFVQVCGVATNMNKEDATFEIVAEQYVSATRSSESFPTRCLIPDTPRFQNYKPIPSKGKFVSVTGFLTGVERNDEKHFLLDVDQVVFLGQQPHSAPKAEHSPNKITSGTPARLKFTGFLGSQGTDTKSWEPSSKKRKTADDRAAEEANDKGEGISSQGRRRH